MYLFDIISHRKDDNMEIARVTRGTITREERKTVSNRKDFYQSVNQAKERKWEEQVKKMVDDIKKKGNRLVITKTYEDVRLYKKKIKEDLESVLQFMYDTQKDISFWQTQYFITVDTVDEKLEELTQAVLGEEKENMSIAATIDEIQGLIVDIYRWKKESKLIPFFLTFSTKGINIYLIFLSIICHKFSSKWNID